MRKVLSMALCLILMSTSIIFIFTGCQKTSVMPETSIKNFEAAFNKYDVNTMLDCLHPTYQQSVSDLLNLLSGSKWNASLVFNLAKIGIPLLPLLTDFNLMPDDLPKLSLMVEDTSIDGNTAECKVACNLTIGKYSTDFENNVVLEKIDGKWYIVKAK